MNNIVTDNAVGLGLTNTNGPSGPTLIQHNLFENNTACPTCGSSGTDIYADQYTAGVGGVNGATINANTFTNTTFQEDAWAFGDEGIIGPVGPTGGTCGTGPAGVILGLRDHHRPVEHRQRRRPRRPDSCGRRRLPRRCNVGRWWRTDHPHRFWSWWPAQRLRRRRQHVARPWHRDPDRHVRRSGFGDGNGLRRLRGRRALKDT